MADIPALSDLTKRKLVLQWDTIRDNQKLTEEHLTGYDLGRQWLSGILTKPPRGMDLDLGGLNIGHTFEDRKRAAYWLGLDPSVRAAKARFRGIDSHYFVRWSCSDAPYETYAAWLDRLKADTVAELASIWKGRSEVTDRWFQGTCAPAIDKALEAVIKTGIRQGRKFEAERLARESRSHAAQRLWAYCAKKSGLPKTNHPGATEPSGDEPKRPEAGPAMNGGGADRRATIYGRRQGIVRRDSFNSGRHRTRRLPKNFRRILAMTASEFEALLKKKGII